MRRRGRSSANLVGSRENLPSIEISLLALPPGSMVSSRTSSYRFDMRKWGVALILLTACGTKEISPTAPQASRGDQRAPHVHAPLIPLEVSVVDAPISYAIAPALAALEHAVPRRFGDIDQRITSKDSPRQSVAYYATRTPFAVTFDGKRVTLTTVISYQGRGWYKPPLSGAVSAACGTSEAPPRLRVVIASDVELSPNWKIVTRTRVRSLTALTNTPRDQCRVTMFNIDVTNRVIEAITPEVAQRLPPLDRQIGRFDVRTPVEGYYNQLNQSFRIRDSLWFVIGPEAVRLGGLRLADTAVVADIRLFARPVMVTGPRPPQITITLPPLTPATHVVGDSAHLLLEGFLGYNDASAALSAELVGRHVSRYGRRIAIRSVRVYPLGDGRVALALGVDGSVTGQAYFVGTPQIDTLTRMLSVPDLDFDVATANALVSGLAWLKKGDLVAELRQRARIPLAPLLDETRGKVESAINRQLADGVHLSGRVQTGRILDVSADPRWFVVRAEATGSLGLAIDREIPGSPVRARRMPGAVQK